MSLEISVIIPAKEEADSLPELGAWISRVMTANNFSYEVIIIDDGSEDETWNQVVKLNQQNSSFKGVRFNRNFGKSAALQTGFKMATGRVVITMDADLQDSPDEIPALYNMIVKDGFHLVSGWKRKRHDPISKTLPSKFFNYLTRRISGIILHDFNCGLKSYDARVVKNISIYGEMHRYIPVVAKWAGFKKIGEKVVEHRERKYGYSKFGWGRMRGLFDLMSITFVGKFALRPMQFFGTLGVLSFLAGSLLTLRLLWEKFDAVFISHTSLKRDLTDQPIFYIALVAVVVGVQFFLTGFIAELLARQSAGKKHYLVIEKVGVQEELVHS